jgi:hypothetical protein
MIEWVGRRGIYAVVDDISNEIAVGFETILGGYDMEMMEQPTERLMLAFMMGFGLGDRRDLIGVEKQDKE